MVILFYDRLSFFLFMVCYFCCSLLWFIILSIVSYDLLFHSLFCSLYYLLFRSLLLYSSFMFIILFTPFYDFFFLRNNYLLNGVLVFSTLFSCFNYYFFALYRQSTKFIILFVLFQNFLFYLCSFRIHYCICTLLRVIILSYF